MKIMLSRATGSVSSGNVSAFDAIDSEECNIVGGGTDDTQLLIIIVSIYTLGDLGVLSNLIGSLSLANEHYSPPTE